MSLLLLFNQGTAEQTLTPARFDNVNTFYAHTIANGSMVPAQLELDGLPIALNGLPLQLLVFQAGGATQTLTPARFDNAQTFFGPTVTRGTVTLSPSRFDNAQTFFGPAVTPGVVTLMPARFDNVQTFFGPIVVVSGGPQTILPARFDNAQTFFGPTVTPGVVTLTPARFDNVQAFFALTLTQGPGGLLPWPTVRAGAQHRAVVPAADVRFSVRYHGHRAVVQQESSTP